MKSTLFARGLAPILILLLLLPSQAQAANTLFWMTQTPKTSAFYVVQVRNTPNTPVVAVANWTVLNVTSTNITIMEDGLLGVFGSLGVSLIANGQVQLLQARVVIRSVYNLTDRLCFRPCQVFSPREHAWEWIPSTNTSSLVGQNFDILSTTFEVNGNQTLAPYNRTAWRLQPLVQVYLPSLLLYNFWYDMDSGILLRADLFSAGDGNLTISLTNTTPNLQIQNVALPLTPTQLSIILLSILASYVILSPKGRIRRIKRSMARTQPIQ